MDPGSSLSPDLGKSVEELCTDFGHLLGLSEAVPQEVMHVAVEDPTYAHHLAVCKNSPDFLAVLFREAATRKKDMRPSCPTAPNAAVLVKRAAQAIWSWAQTGFAILDESIYETRLSACLQCPHLGSAPDSMVYKLASLNALDTKVCTLCGCLVRSKARLPSEKCPSRHPTEAGLNRWGELYR